MRPDSLLQPHRYQRKQRWWCSSKWSLWKARSDPPGSRNQDGINCAKVFRKNALRKNIGMGPGRLEEPSYCDESLTLKERLRKRKWWKHPRLPHGLKNKKSLKKQSLGISLSQSQPSEESLLGIGLRSCPCCVHFWAGSSPWTCCEKVNRFHSSTSGCLATVLL